MNIDTKALSNSVFPSLDNRSVLQSHPLGKTWKDITNAAVSSAIARKSANQACRQIAENLEVLRTEDSASSSVSLYAPLAAFKEALPRASEEENLMQTFFSIYGNNELVSCCPAKNLSFQDLGLDSLTENDKKFGFKLSELPDLASIFGILKNLSPKKFLQNSHVFQQNQSDFVQKGDFPSWLEKENPVTLAKALSDFPGEVWAVPDFDLYDEIFFTNYSNSFSQKYNVVMDGAVKVLSFQELQQTFLTREDQTDISIHVVDNSNEEKLLSLKDPALKQFLYILDVSWKIILPRPLVFRSESLTYAPLIKADVKPFARGMKFIFNDQKYPEAVKDHIFSRPSVEEELTACFLTEFQPLDIHNGNIAVTLTKNAQTKKFQTLSFSCSKVNQKNICLEDLAELFLRREISLDDDVECFDLKTSETQVTLTASDNMAAKTFTVERQKPTQYVSGKLRDIEGLTAALQTPWRLTAFDFDLILAESNYLQWYIYGTKKLHNVPFRFALLSTNWAHTVRLQQKTIDTLLDGKEREELLDNFVDRSDSPAYLRLNKEDREKLRGLVIEFTKDEEFSFTCQKSVLAKDQTFSNAKLREIFANKLSLLESHFEFWQFLEKSLKETLTTNSTAAKRKKVAKSLFPHLSFRQKNALKERRLQRKEYLTNEKKLADLSSLSFGEKVQFLDQLLKLSSTPLATKERKAFKKRLNRIDETTIQDFENELKTRLLPSFANVVKSQYPLLADFYRLSSAVYTTTKSEGQIWQTIGSYEFSIEELICEYLNQQIRKNSNLKKNLLLSQHLTCFSTFLGENCAIGYLKSFIESADKDDLGDEKDALLALASALFEQNDPNCQNPASFFMEIAE